MKATATETRMAVTAGRAYDMPTTGLPRQARPRENRLGQAQQKAKREGEKKKKGKETNFQ